MPSYEFWGTDIRLFNRDLRVSPSGDIELVTELDNIAQALRHRLTTEKGFLPYDSEYGLDLSLFIGRKNLVEKQELLKFAIVDAIKKEPRIQTINEIKITQDANNPTRLYANVTVTPITSQETVSLNLVYPWYETRATQRIVDEETISTSRTTLTVDYDVYGVEGVYTSTGPHYVYTVSTDRLVSGTNYYEPSGSFYGKTITLSKSLPSTFSTVYVTYQRYLTEGKSTT